MNKWKLSTKLITLILICVLGIVVIGAFGAQQLQIVNNSVEEMYSEFMQGLNMLGELRAYNEEISKLIFLYQLTTRQTELNKLREDIDFKLDQVAVNVTKLYAYTADPVVREKMDNVVEKMAPYNQFREVLTYAERDGSLQADLQQLFSYQEDVLLAIQDLENYHLAYGASLYNDSKKVYSDSRKILLFMILLSITIALVFETMVYHSIFNPIKKLIGTTQKLKTYDLTAQIETKEHKTEIGQLALAFNEAVLNLRNLIGQIENTAGETTKACQHVLAIAEETNEGARQTACTVEDLAETTQQQMRQAQTMAKAIEKVENAVGQIKGNHERAKVDTTRADLLSQEGNTYIVKNMEQMDKIRQVTLNIGERVKELGQFSDKIGEIIEIIGSIAQQTNLLALNAAIEAANAGEYGRGFAVVAEEIRQLAEQSEDSVKQIDDFINKIQEGVERVSSATDKGVKEVQAGSKTVEQSGESFAQIMKAMDSIKEAVTNVGFSTDKITEESESLKTVIFDSMNAYQSISAHTEEVSVIAEEQASMVAETTRSIQNLARLAEELKKSIEHFKV